MTEPHPTLTPKDGILEIEPYVGGESGPASGNRLTKLSSNENPLGPSESAIEAYRRVAGDLAIYPSTDHAALRDAIAEGNRLDADRVICHAGSDEIIAFLCNTYAAAGDEVIHTEHGFAMYRISTLAAGATPVEVQETDRTTDVEAILDACTDRTRLVFIANPNNPTGTMIDAADVERLADGLPPQALLVLDGAYAEYVPDFDAGLALIDARDNVVMTRTFSKIYGLAALRVGWGYGPAHVINALNRVRGPFNVSAAALAAAEASVQDTGYTERCRAGNTKWRGWLAAQLADAGVPSDPSQTNFLLARFDSPQRAEGCDIWLRERGVIVRKVAGYNLPCALRITVGDEIACRLVASAVKDFMETQSK